MILCDFDRVDITNLQRQQYKADQIGMYKTDALTTNLKEIAPYISIKARTKRITEENAATLLKDADIICEAFDDAECKAMLTNTVLTEMNGKYLIAASGMAGLYDANLIKTRKITSRFYLCGDEKSDIANESGLISSLTIRYSKHVQFSLFLTVQKTVFKKMKTFTLKSLQAQ